MTLRKLIVPLILTIAAVCTTACGQTSKTGANIKQADLVSVAGRPPGSADINGDGTIDTRDQSVLFANLNAKVIANTSGDLNGDGVVNAADLSVFTSALRLASIKPIKMSDAVARFAGPKKALLLQCYQTWRETADDDTVYPNLDWSQPEITFDRAWSSPYVTVYADTLRRFAADGGTDAVVFSAFPGYDELPGHFNPIFACYWEQVYGAQAFGHVRDLLTFGRQLGLRMSVYLGDAPEAPLMQDGKLVANKAGPGSYVSPRWNDDYTFRRNFLHAVNSSALWIRDNGGGMLCLDGAALIAEEYPAQFDEFIQGLDPWVTIAIEGPLPHRDVRGVPIADEMLRRWYANTIQMTTNDGGLDSNGRPVDVRRVYHRRIVDDPLRLEWERLHAPDAAKYQWWILNQINWTNEQSDDVLTQSSSRGVTLIGSTPFWDNVAWRRRAQAKVQRRASGNRHRASVMRRSYGTATVMERAAQ